MLFTEDEKKVIDKVIEKEIKKISLNVDEIIRREKLILEGLKKQIIKNDKQLKLLDAEIKRAQNNEKDLNDLDEEIFQAQEKVKGMM